MRYFLRYDNVGPTLLFVSDFCLDTMTCGGNGRFAGKSDAWRRSKLETWARARVEQLGQARSARAA